MISSKTKLVLVLCSLFAITACGKQEDVQGQGNATQETREVSTFHGVDINGHYQVVGEIGTPQALLISSNANILPHILTDVSKDILHVDNKPSTSLHPTVPQKVTFRVAEFESLKLQGETTFYLSNLDSKKLDIALAGSHQLLLGGKAEDVNVVIDGTSSINAKALTAKNISIVINGTGLTEVSPTNSLKVVINGSGKVINYGKGVKVEQVVNGAGRVENSQ